MGNIVDILTKVAVALKLDEEVRYVLCPKREKRNLDDAVKELEKKKDALEERIRERVLLEPGNVPAPDFKVWMKSLDDLAQGVKDIHEGNSPCFHISCCCNNYEVGKEINRKLSSAKELLREYDKWSSDGLMNVGLWIDPKMALKDRMQKLHDMRVDLERKVQQKEMEPRMERSQTVQTWIRKVDTLDAEVKRMITYESEIQSPNSENDAVNIARKRQEVEKLIEEYSQMNPDALVVMGPLGKFHDLPPETSHLPPSASVGIEEVVDRILTRLKSDGYDIIGIHGMGGAGKTTIVREVTHKLRSSEDIKFDLFKCVVVTRNPDMRKIQGEIFAGLGYLRDDPRLPTDINDRADLLREKLAQKDLLLVFDDMWKPFNLHDVGVPERDAAKKRCKLLITTRDMDVCSKMGCQKPEKVGMLGESDSWDLFKMMIQDNELLHSRNIYPLAQHIVTKCGGLPIVIKTVACAMIGKGTDSQWKEAKSAMDHFPDAINGMKDVYARLKFSFDSLESEKLKHCLLYCALYPEDYEIYIEDLIEYWIADGFETTMDEFDFDKLRSIARNDIISSLVKSSLLEQVGDMHRHVRLHDAVRDMAIWLGNEYNIRSKAGEGLSGKYVVENLTGVKMMSLMFNDIDDLHVSHDIEQCCVRTLLLNGNKIRNLPENLFYLLPALRILDLSISSIEIIPKSIGSLKSLEYLNLQSTRIRELPVELGNLLNLKYLNLCGTYELDCVPSLAISPLKKLRYVNFFDSKALHSKGKDNFRVKDLNDLIFLNEVCLTIEHIEDADSLFKSELLAKCTTSLCLGDAEGEVLLNFSRFQRLKIFKLERYTCGELKLNCDSFPSLTSFEIDSSPLQNIITTCPLVSLEVVWIQNCEMIEQMTFLKQLPNLRYLSVAMCDNLKVIIGEESRDDSHKREEIEETPLSKLKSMSLIYLPLLQCFSVGNVSLPSLVSVSVHGCQKLKNLSILSYGSTRTEILCNKEWWECLEWGEGDEESRSRFNPIFDL